MMTVNENNCDVGVVGLGVMAKNLVLNMTDHGFRVAIYNRTSAKVDKFINSEEAQGKAITPCQSLGALVKCLSSPRKVMLMIKVGDPVATTDVKLYPDLSPIDAAIAELCGLLSPGDVIIDDGNTHCADTERRAKYVEARGLLYVGAGISGGDEGARHGPSIMPGGNEKAWAIVRPLFESIAAKAGADVRTPCVDWIGPGGAGHYVKMVHNGIEYGNMQLICEAYWMLKQVLGMSNAELHDVFSQWNKTELNSYLIEITRDIFVVHDQETGEDLVDLILDQAGAKGTGKWMSQLALDLGVPSTLVTSAVYARPLSAMKNSRCRASKVLAGTSAKFRGDRKAFIEDIRQALYASTICSYAQGFVQLQAAATEYRWSINFGSIASLWREGCIIRAALLDPIREAFKEDPNLENLLFAPHFTQAIKQAQPAWRRVVMLAAELGVPAPVFSAALAYYDGFRSERLPANLLQAQRDYFGGHKCCRVDKPSQGLVHIEWRRLASQFCQLCDWLRPSWLWSP